THITVDKELYNSGHLLNYGTYTILDPAQQWTIDRIVNVCKEIVTNYDVDGILYDDYFYPDGIPTNSTAGDYTEWQESGTSLSFADWRRDNVNRMVKAVYEMIQTVKPWCRFGISPAGVAATSSAVAAKYGVEPCPSGSSDWQYNGIFSDPLAWISSQTLDYISPQVYWKIGATANYATITPWWGQVVKKFGRHVYISTSISSIKTTSTANDYVEYANQAEINRTSSLDGAFGSIYYSCKYLYMRNPNSLASFLRESVYKRPALVPVLPWKEGNNPGKVKNLTMGNGGKLSWDGYDNVRYSVYAMPATMHPSTFTQQVDYLLDMSYATEYQIPVEYQGADWQYAVCVVDRVGNEYEPEILGGNLEQLGSPVLIAPAADAATDMPFAFTWSKVKDATSYVVEISNDADFGSVAERFTTTDTTFSALEFSQLRHEATQYWRVQAQAPQHYSGVSEIRSIVPMMLTITYPADAEEEVAADFTAKWYNLHSSAEATVEIAYDQAFQSIVFTGKSATGELAIPAGALESGNTCYMRVRLTVDGHEMVANPVRFTIAHEAARFIRPVDGGEIFKGEYVEVKAQSWASNYQVEISNSATTWGRTRFVETLKDGATRTSVTADAIKVNSKTLVDGSTYYARVKTAYEGLDGQSHTTEWGPVVKFIYRATPALKGDVNADGEVNVSDVTALINQILGTAQYPQNRCDINADGVVNVSDVTALINLILG
ncbi:MAG: family 10 glycosylhydrolase, partial [Bacteroidales bacterium]|nr:family 10 glycosylhydrolase [Bacteroidales bacterium]